MLAGEVEYFAVLVERYRVAFSYYAAGLCGDADTAADAMQEAFIRAFDALTSCRDPSRFKAWFFRILTNQCHNVRRRKRDYVSLTEVDVPARERADHRATWSELEQAFEAALEDLTPEQREAFLLKHMEGRSYAEMAELLDVGEDALKMRVHRARDIVKARLEKFL